MINVYYNDFINNHSLDSVKEEISSSIPRIDGKEICRQKREMRESFAKANNISYTPAECNYDGPCAGTCKMCETETQLLLLRASQSNKEVLYPNYRITGGLSYNDDRINL